MTKAFQKRSLLAVGALIAAMPARGGTDYTQDFQTWTSTASYVTMTNEGWFVHQCRITGNYKALMTNAASPVIRSPVLSNGIGRISFEACNLSSGTNTFTVSVFSNQTWVLVDTRSITNFHASGLTPSNYSRVIDLYDTNAMIQIGRVQGSSPLYVDNITITWAAAIVSVTNVVTVPSQPVAGSPVEIQAQIFRYYGASNVAPAVFYRTLSGTGFTNSVPMSQLSGNDYETDGGGLPALDIPGSGVEYYIRTIFEGSQGIATNLYPAGAPTGGVLRFTFQPLSTYGAMQVTGSLSQAMMLADNYLWEKAVSVSGALTNPVFAFRSGAQTWGDANPSVSNLPVYGTAETGATIVVSGVVTSPIVFRFQDGGTQALEYSIQRCAYVNFDDWSGAEAYSTYTNADGWVIRGGAISTTNSYDTDRALTGRFCMLRFGTGGGTQFLASPLLPRGVGTISFRYRHRDDPTSGMAGFQVQTSTNGTDWVTLGSAVTNVRSLGYLRYYASAADPDARYVRILNHSVPSNSWLCLDEVIVTDPAATVKLGNPWRSTDSPQVGDFVSVSIDAVTIAGGATNLAGHLYFRHTNDSMFSAVELTRQTNRFVGQLPPMADGPVRYYFMCTFDGFGAGPVYYPPGGANDPNLLVYTNSGVLPNLRYESFTSWSTFATYTNYSTNGWTIQNARIQYNGEARKARLAFGGSIMSSLLTNGIGTVYFQATASGGPSSNTVAIQTSSNGLDWVERGQFGFTNYSGTGGNLTNSVLSLLDQNPLYLRLVYTNSTAASPPDVFIDNVTATPPPADVEIFAPSYAPGYPSTNEPITIWCDVTSVSTAFPAFAISPKIYHRMGSGSWSVTPMQFAGTNRYVGTIGPYPHGDVSYFIRCDFSGYYFYNAAWGVNDNQSPAFSPDAAPTATEPPYFYSLTVRPYRSDYGYMVATGNFAAVTMNLVGDDVWAGVIDPGESNRLEISMGGLWRYTGYGYSSGVDVWGAAGQARTSPPLYGDAVANGTNLVVEGDDITNSQIIVLLDLNAASFVVLRGAYQDFNKWVAPTNYFDESLGRDQITRLTLNFDDWPLDAPYTTWRGNDLEDFQDGGWVTGYYANATFNAPGGWYIDDAAIIREVEGPTNKAASLAPLGDRGEVWPFRSTLTDGLGSFTFRYRASTTNWQPTIYSPGTAWDNYRVDMSLKADLLSPMTPALSILARYQNPDNYYEYRVFRTNVNQLAVQIWKKKAGVMTRIGATSPWDGSLMVGRNCAFVVVTNNGGAVCLEAYEGTTRRLTVVDTSDPLSGPGTIGIGTMDADISADDIVCAHMHIQGFDNWSQASTGNYTSAGWTINNGRPTSGYCLLQTNGLLQSPQLPYQVGWLSFTAQRESGTNVQLTLYGSADGSAWEWIDIQSGIGGSITWSNNAINTSYRYFRWVNTCTTGVLRLDSIYISAATNFYTQNFASDAAGWTTDGKWYRDAGSQTFRRAGYNGPSIGFIFETARTNGSSPNYPDPSQWTNTVTISASNLTYVTTSIVTRLWQRSFVRLKHMTGDANLVVDDLTMTSWRATNNLATNGWQVKEAWIAQERPGSNYVELWRSRANPDAAQSVRTPWMSNSVGALSFRYRALYGAPATFDVEAGYVEISPDLFTETLASVTVPAGSTNWQNYELILNTNQAMYLRVRHTSTNVNSVLALDNIVVTDYAPRDERTWTAYNALITYTENTREFEPFRVPAEDFRTCYLNNNPSNGVAPGRVLNASRPYLQSPRLRNGLGGIRFWYRNWEASGSPAARIHFYWTDSDQPDMTPFTNWNYLGTVPNFTNTQYRYFVTNVYEDTARYLRLYTETTGVARVCLDNVLLTEPLGASFDVDYLSILPAIPVTNDEVRFETRLSNFFYDPSNLDVRVYYTVGSNEWGTWTPSLSVPLILVASNASSQTYRTPEGYGIPPKPVDSVVQYFLSVSYQGLFSNRTSPRRYKTFSNPSWYAPVNLNAGKTNTNPYYFVFSCRPGEVWINEVNYEYWWAGINNEYVEICGPAGVNVHNWSVQLCEPYEPYAPYAIHRITNIVSLANHTNGFGFWVLGDAAVSGVDQVFTNTPDGTRHLHDPGGVRLVRSMGAYAHAVSYGDTDPNMEGFEYIGHKDDLFTDSPLFLQGTGSNYNNFSWNYVAAEGYLTPRAQNVSQTLSGQNEPPPQVEIRILRMGLTPTNMWLAFTGTNTMSPPVVWYSTNLLQPGGGWTRVTNSFYTYGSGVYTQWFAKPTNSPVYFYRVVTTNTP